MQKYLPKRLVYSAFIKITKSEPKPRFYAENLPPVNTNYKYIVEFNMKDLKKNNNADKL